MLSVADVQNSGNTRRPITALRSPDTSSSLVSVPASKNFSISWSSASATISMSASRAARASASRAPGTASSRTVPLPSGS